MDATGTIHYNMSEDDYDEHQNAWMDGLSKKRDRGRKWTRYEKRRAEEKAMYEKERQEEELEEVNKEGEYPGNDFWGAQLGLSVEDANEVCVSEGIPLRFVEVN